MSSPVAPGQRYTRAHRCSVCTGAEQDPRGEGRRCSGFESSDGEYAHCSRPEHAGALPLEEASQTYAHRLTGDCRCGQQHGARPEPARPSTPVAPQRVVATYAYSTLEGEPIEVLRYGPLKTFKQRRPDPSRPGEWIWHLTPKCERASCGCQHQELRELTPRLYHADRLREPLGREQTIYIVEGERDAETLAALGLAATTNIGGAGKWRERYSQELVGATVIVIADRDEPGRQHARAVATSLAPQARSVKVIEVGVKDVTDFVFAGGTRAELERIAEQAAAWMEASRPPIESDVAAGRGARALTDLANAQRLVERHGRELRYCAALEAWYVWDGRRFLRDETGEVVRRATETVLSMYAQAAALEDRKSREELVRHAVRSEADAKIAAMLHLARSDARIAVRADQFDVDPWALNALNGVVDLRTGELRPHSPANLMTRLAPVAFDPAARLELWDDVLYQATGGDSQLLRYLERAVGYSLTGDTREEVLFLVEGPTASSKSTIAEAVKGALGDYAVTADFDTFLARRDGGPRNDIARLAGRRLVISIEMEKGRRLAEGLVKQLTGGDTLAARFLYRESFEFRPQFKLWLVANTRPRVSDDDAAMWRRIRRLPFEHTIPEAERDPTVKIRLRDPAIGGPAVLAWAVKGCLAWQREGLRTPERVRRATELYRQEMDPLAAFLEERCVLDEAAAAPAGELYSAYVLWARDSGERQVLTSREFGLRLTGRGLVADRTNASRTRRGIRLADQQELRLQDGEMPA